MTTQTLTRQPSHSLLDGIFRILAAAAFSFFLAFLVQRFLISHEPVFLMLAIGEGLTLALVILARSPMVRSTHPWDIALTLGATFYFLLIQLESGRALVPEPWPVLLYIGAIVWQIWAKWTLGRSFGLLPANRGVVQSGPYRVVRHPIYLGYLVGHMAFLCGFFSWQNLTLLLCVYLVQGMRLLREEKVLKADPAYQAYMTTTRWRLLPGLF